MILEHVFTSLPKGLNPGSRGFSTAAATRGLTPPFVQLCESLSGYTHVFALQSPDYPKNPVSFSHYRTLIGGRTWLVLSRVAALPADYSGRTNKLAHHLLVPPSDTTPAGPAAELSVPDRFLTRWEGEARYLPENRVSLSNPADPVGPALGWQRAAGDAGWAGVLARHWLRNPEGTAYLVFTPGTELLPLFDETLRLIPPERRWEVTFSTYITAPPAGMTCHWRGCLPDNPLLRAAAKQTGTLIIDLAGPGAVPAAFEADPLVCSARSGQPPAWTEADRHPPAPDRQGASRPTPVIDIPVETPAHAPVPRRITSIRAAPRRKKPLPLWLPPLAACVAIGLMAAYLMFDNKTKPQRPSPQSEAAYCAVTNFFADYEKAAKEIAEQQKALIGVTNGLFSIIAETNYTEQLQKSMADVNGRWSTLTNFPIPNLERPDCQLLSHRPDYASLSSKVETSWAKWTTQTNEIGRLIKSANESKKDAKNRITELEMKDEKPLKKPASAPSVPRPESSEVTTIAIEKLITDLVKVDLKGADSAAPTGFVSRAVLSNCLYGVSLYEKASQRIDKFTKNANAHSNDVLSVTRALTDAWISLKDSVSGTLDASSSRITAHASATDLKRYTFPTNEAPDQVFLYDAQCHAITVTNVPKQFVFEPDFPLASVLAITTRRGKETLWHLFQPGVKQDCVASLSTDWTLCNLANGDYGLICSPSSPLYRLVTGITQTVDDIGIQFYTKSWTSNAVFSVRKKDAVPGEVFKNLTKLKTVDGATRTLKEWLEELAAKETRGGFQKILDAFKKKNDDQKSKTADAFKRDWEDLEAKLPAAESLRVMLKVAAPDRKANTNSPSLKGTTGVNPGKDAFKLVQSSWFSQMPNSTNLFKKAVDSLSSSEYRKEFDTVLDKISSVKSMMPAKDKKKLVDEIMDQWRKAEEQYQKCKAESELVSSEKNAKDEAGKELEAAFSKGLMFDLVPVLNKLREENRP